MSTTKTVTSNPDPQSQQVTILDIIKEDAGTITLSVKLRKPNQSPVEVLRANIADLFAIRFTKHNLVGDAVTPNWAYWGFLEYRPSAGEFLILPDLTDVVVNRQPGVALKYKFVEYKVDTSKVDLTGLPISPLPAYVKDLTDGAFGTIDVTVTIAPTVQALNFGWLNFDITHTYPAKFPAPGTPAALKEGWEERIIFPAGKFTSPDNSTLLPLGYGPLESAPEDRRTQRPLLPLGYGALYKIYPGRNANPIGPDRAQGVAIHVDDDRGHYRESYYNKSKSELSFHLQNPVHLKDLPGGKSYVKPRSYTMTLGDNYGFGGNIMIYRLRAFEIAAVRVDVPIDSRDVLDIYRRWIRGRKPLFYRKYRTRGTDGPLDSMAMHTVVTNFSLDGPVDVDRNAKLASWLEVHPAKHGEPNVLNNPNESLLRLLSRLRSRFNRWHGWEDLAGFLKAGPAVSSWGANRLDCFAWGADDQLYHRAFNGVWGNWEPLGGVLTSGPAAVSWGVNRIDCFVRGSDNALYHKFYDGAWHNWEPLGGGLTSGPAASSWGPGRLDVFARGTDNGLWHKAFINGVWGNWGPLGGTLTSSPAAVARGVNHIDVFVRGTGNAIYQNTFNGSTLSGSINLGTPSSTVQAASAPAVCSMRPNRLDLFVRGTDNALWRRIFDGAWGSWERIGGVFDNAPAAASMQPERIDCFVRSVPNSTMSHVWSDLSTPADSVGPARPVFLEAQLWNCEMAGLYRFYAGFPPMADVLSSPPRFKRGMDELSANGILPYFTTDPLNCILNRKRFRGHLIKDGAAVWKQAISDPFPDAVKDRTCAATDVDITVSGVTHKDVDRVWYVHKEPNIILNPEPKGVESCGEAATALGSLKIDSLGRSRIFAPGAMGNGFYRALSAQMCPTPAIEGIYLNSWLQNGLFAYGARLVEFMKHSFYGSSYCYNKNHQHIVPPDPNDLPDPAEPADQSSLPYTTVIGRGFWYIRRCRSILRGVQRRGLAKNASFALTNEFSPSESMLPYIDEHYTVDGSTHFVYSNMLTAKIGAFTDFTLPPGYQEKRKNTQLLRVPPAEMLSSARDDEPQPANTDVALDSSFANWLDICTRYFNSNFVVSEPGLSAQNYQVYTANPGVLAKYSFCRGIQDLFNLRARIFNIGSAAVGGFRIIVPAVYMEEPYDYNEEVVNFASRAAQLLFRHREFFRRGFIVGETPLAVKKANNQNFISPTVWAWGSYYINGRPFRDAQELVNDITREDSYLGTDYRQVFQSGSNDKTFKVHDFISHAVDRRIYYFKDPQGNLLELYRNKIGVFLRVSHLIWQIGEPDVLKVLYLFVNVTNTPTQVEFLYDKGLATPAGVTWTKTISWISGDGNSQIVGTTKFGQGEKQIIPPRSFMSVELKR